MWSGWSSREERNSGPVYELDADLILFAPDGPALEFASARLGLHFELVRDCGCVRRQQPCSADRPVGNDAFHDVSTTHLDRAERAMMAEVHAAVAEAAEHLRDQVRAAGLDLASAPKTSFDAVVHQRMYLTICGATVGTFEGGDARKAIGLIRNQQIIANRY